MRSDVTRVCAGSFNLNACTPPLLVFQRAHKATMDAAISEVKQLFLGKRHMTNETHQKKKKTMRECSARAWPERFLISGVGRSFLQAQEGLLGNEGPHRRHRRRGHGLLEPVTAASCAGGLRSCGGVHLPTSASFGAHFSVCQELHRCCTAGDLCPPQRHELLASGSIFIRVVNHISSVRCNGSEGGRNHPLKGVVAHPTHASGGVKARRRKNRLTGLFQSCSWGT